MSIQLPNHHGRPSNQPSASRALKANSPAFVAVYIAITTLVPSFGATAKAYPAKLAPTAGARLEVNTLDTRGFLLRKGAASFVSRFKRKREKKRWSRR